MNQKIKVFIDGKEGTTGLQIYDRMMARGDVELLLLPDDLRKDVDARREFINKSDVTFLCLPDAAAIEAAALCENEKTIIIDASTAHRTHPDWDYGFPELSAAHREAIKVSRRIANPGCHASGFLALVYPLVKMGIIAPDYPLVSYSLTGYSGGGKKMIAEYEAADRDVLLDSPRQYAIGQTHKHLREMQAVAGLTHPPVFSPIVGDFAQGMEVSVPLYGHLMSGVSNLEELHAKFCAYYNGQPMVEVLPLMGEGVLDRGFFPANMYASDNRMHILIAGNLKDGDGRVLLCALFDNLGKGASGAAVQNMNIALGLDECMGLI